MNPAFASFLFAQISGAVYAAIAFAGVASVVLLVIATFKSLFGDD